MKNMFLMREARLTFGAPWDQHLGGSFLQSRVGEQRQAVDSQREEAPGRTQGQSMCGSPYETDGTERNSCLHFLPFSFRESLTMVMPSLSGNES